MNDLRARRPTLKDVAALAGVDASLVSRVVSGDSALSIPDSTRKRVLDAVAEVGYRPSAAARSLRTQRLSTLGLIIPDLTNPVYAPIVAGAQEAASSAGYALLLASDTEGPAREAARALARMLAEDRVDGLLVASGTPNSDLLGLLGEIGKPSVLVNRAITGIPSVTVDDETGARMATQHLLDHGHQHLLHLAGPRGLDTTDRRRTGFSSAVRGSQGAHAEATVHAKSWGAEDGYSAGLELLAKRGNATAIFVANVTLAIGLYRAAHESGVVIPRDLSVVALHDYDLAAMLVPSLTTVAMPLHELGGAAVRQLLNALDGESPGDQMVRTMPVLVERNSVLQH